MGSAARHPAPLVNPHHILLWQGRTMPQLQSPCSHFDDQQQASPDYSLRRPHLPWQWHHKAHAHVGMVAVRSWSNEKGWRSTQCCCCTSSWRMSGRSTKWCEVTAAGAFMPHCCGAPQDCPRPKRGMPTRLLQMPCGQPCSRWSPDRSCSHLQQEWDLTHTYAVGMCICTGWLRVGLLAHSCADPRMLLWMQQ